MAERWSEFLSAWEAFHAEADEYRELDDERVLVHAHFTGRGKTSGLEVGEMRTRGASLFHIRAGKVTSLFLAFSGERALADLGLTPEGES